MTMHQDVQAKVQGEIDSALGGSRLPELEDQDSLPYVRNIMKEVFRRRSVTWYGWYPASARRW